jgi:hypothetical protein
LAAALGLAAAVLAFAGAFLVGAGSAKLSEASDS